MGTLNEHAAYLKEYAPLLEVALEHYQHRGYCSRHFDPSTEVGRKLLAAADAIDALTAENERRKNLIVGVAAKWQIEANAHEGTSYGDRMRNAASELLAALGTQ